MSAVSDVNEVTGEGATPDSVAADPDTARKPLDSDWQNLWFSLQRTPWTALTVVPADSGLAVGDVADAIVEVGRMSGADLTLVNALGATFTDAQEIVDTISTSTRRGRQVVVACDAVDDNPATLALAHATAHTVMVVRLGQSRMASARKTIEAIGREQVIAAVTLRPRR